MILENLFGRRKSGCDGICGALVSLGWKIEKESDTAFFFNHAPWVAPYAYLHEVYKPAPAAALMEVKESIQLPQHWSSFLAIQNGAHLFSGALNIYGAISKGVLLNRRDIFNCQPFNLISENVSWPPSDPKNEVVIGGWYDGSLVVLDRHTGAVSAMRRRTYEILARWQDAETWIRGEILRLNTLYDKDGKLVVDAEETLPK